MQAVQVSLSMHIQILSPHYLERLGQLSTTRIAWIHCDKGHHTGLQGNAGSFKQELLLASPQSIQNGLYTQKSLIAVSQGKLYTLGPQRTMR